MGVARDPLPAAVAEMLVHEAKTVAAPLADMLFGHDAFTDSRNVDRPEYLRFFRWAAEHGIVTKDGTQVPADEWRLKTLDRLGGERYWADMHEAYDLSPARGLAQVRLALEPPQTFSVESLPPPPTEEGI